MRVLLLSVFYPTLALTSFINPYFGLLNYAFITIIRPEALTWGGAAVKHTSVIAISALALSCLIKNKARFNEVKDPFFLALVFYAICLYFSTLVSAYSDSQSFYYTRPLIFIVIFCFAQKWLITDRPRFFNFVTMLVIFFFLMSVWGIDQRMRGNLIVEGLFGNYIIDRCAITGVYILVFPLAVFKFKYARGAIAKFLATLAVICFVLIIFFSDSRAGFLGFLTCLLVMFLFSEKRVKSASLIFVFLVTAWLMVPHSYQQRMNSIFSATNEQYIEDVRDNSSESRVMMWQIAFRVFVENPFLGVGNLNFTKVALTLKENYLGKINDELFHYIFRPTGALQCHNMFINILAEGGLITASLFYFVIFWPLVRAVKTIKLHTKRTISKEDRQLLDFIRFTGAGYIGYLVTAFFANDRWIEYQYWIGTLLIIATQMLQNKDGDCSSGLSLNKKETC